MIKKVDRKACVYDVILNGVIVYVGQTVDPKSRWAQHRYAKRFPKGVEFKVHQWYDTVRDARIAEGVRQRDIKPRYCKIMEGGGALADRPYATRIEFDENKALQGIDERCKTCDCENYAEYMKAQKDKFALSLGSVYLKYIDEGMSNAEIAEGMCMTKNELRGHVERFRVLQLANHA